MIYVSATYSEYWRRNLYKFQEVKSSARFRKSPASAREIDDITKNIVIKYTSNILRQAESARCFELAQTSKLKRGLDAILEEIERCADDCHNSQNWDEVSDPRTGQTYWDRIKARIDETKKTLTRE